MKKIILLTLVLGLFQSCNYDHSKTSTDSGGDNNATSTPDPGEPTDPGPPAVFISYNLIKTNTTAVCMNCHNGKKNPNLSTKQGMINNMNDVLADVATDDMPTKGTPLTVCQKAVLQKWYDLGSPDTSDVTVDSLPACQ